MRGSLAGSSALLAAALVAGCGISLDLDPQSRLPGMDAGEGRRDGGRRPPLDGATFDSTVDDAAAADDGAMGISDGADVRTDASVTSCPGSPCDPVLQCGCTDPTTPTCDLDFASAAFCRAAGGSMRNDQCAYPEDCDVGLTCLILDLGPLPTATMGICTAFCSGDPDCGGFGGVCVPAFSTAGLCTKGCDPVNPGGQCPGSLECVFADFLGGTYCRDGMGVAGEGEACTFTEECVAGTVCDTATGFCTALCYSDRDCPGGATGACAPWSSLGGRILGLCPLL